jgi:hypothetical protein
MSEPVDPFDPVEQAKQIEEANRSAKAKRDDAVRVLLARKEAYTRVFAGAGSADDVKYVMDDLCRFCRGDTSTFSTDPAVHALLTGRQEVYYRIRDFTLLSLDQLNERYNKQ